MPKEIKRRREAFTAPEVYQNTVTIMKTTAIKMFVFAMAVLVSSWALAADTDAGYQPRIDKEGWEILFDGKNLDAWDSQPEPAAWEITEKGELRPAKPGPNLKTKRRFGDFVLEMDYKLAPKRKSNSGIFFRVHDPKGPVYTGMQMQILDNADYGIAYDAKNANGALYGLVSPAVEANVPVGQWNHCRIAAKGRQINMTLNGKQVVNADLEQWATLGVNPDGTKNNYPRPVKALSREGFIILENYGAVPVWFRNIRIKPLTP